MAKPFNAIEMPTAFDLSETAISSALAMMLEARGGNLERNSYRHLRIASQNMAIATALALRLHNPFYIDMSFTYSHDEWSLHENTWNKQTEQYDEIIVWSPGA